MKKLELTIVKNPRKSEGFTNPEAVCDKCGKLSTYYAELHDPTHQTDTMFCKTCLDGMIRAIDKTMRDDMARPVEVCRAEAETV